jgi:predicted ribosome quality control (RQC) complex YloA/Tae2 family protein
MDALVRASPATNPSRPILPHLRYVPPPREAKLDPHEERLNRWLQEETARHPEVAASELLVRGVAGCSPLVAREALARGSADANGSSSDVPSWEDVVTALRGLAAPLETGAWGPSIARRDAIPVDYAPYRLTQFPDAEIVPFDSMSAAIRAADARPVTTRPFDLLKKPLLSALEERSEQARRKRGSLERTLADAEQADELRLAGEAILASVNAIEPGSSALQWDGRRIDLYPTLSPIENADSYFRRYASARDARRVVPPLLAEVEAELEHLDELALHVRLAASQRDLSALRAELTSGGILRDRSPSKPGKKPGKSKTPASSGLYRTVSVNGAHILVGASAVGNDTCARGAYRLPRSIYSPRHAWPHRTARLATPAKWKWITR